MTPEPRLTETLYCGDNLIELRAFPSESVDLIYLDPPFFSNRRYEVVFGDEEEVRSFEDRWSGGIRVYVDWMRERMEELHRVLKSTGSVYLHCDPNASHYLKLMMDLVFEPENFRSEIVWKRTSAHSDTRQGRRQHGRVHDVLLFYTKSDEWTWNVLYQAYDARYIESKYKYRDERTGRRYRLDNLTGPGGAAKGNPQYEVMGVTRYWRYSREKMAELIREDRIVQTRPGAVPQYKRYLDEMKGIPLQDVWTDIDPINSQAAERLGYPTQKPESLLERIVSASSDQNDIVLDPFCGCGTATAVAHKLGRRWIGIDIAPKAIRVCETRMRKLGAAPTLIGVPETVASLMELKPFAFQNWVISQIRGRHSPRMTADMGIDGYSMDGDPVQVKRSRSVGRGVIDTFQTAVQRARKARGFIVAGSFTKGAREEAARARQDAGIDIRLVTVGDLFDDRKLEAHGLFPSRLFSVEAEIPKAVPEALPSAEQLVLSDVTAEQPEEVEIVGEPEMEPETPAPETVQSAADLAAEILRSAAEQRPPINLTPILERLNIEVRNDPTVKEDARLQSMTPPVEGQRPGAWTIYLNPNRPEARKRYTIAHELGHVALHGESHSLAAAARGAGGRRTAREREVERFAAELLMPEQSVRAAVRQHGANVERLRALFLVSPKAMEIRFRELGLG